MPDDLSLNLEDEQTPEVDTPSTPEASLPPDQQEQATETTPALPPSLLARAQQAGLDGLDQIDSTDKFAEYLLDRFVQVQPYADYGRSALAQQPAAVEHAQQKSAVQKEDEQQGFDEHKYFSEAWQVPTLSPAASFLLEKGAFELNDLGMIAPAKGYESLAMPHLQEVQAYQQSKAAQNESFAQNPVKFMAEKLLPYFEHKFSDRWQNTVQERFQEYEHQNFETKFIEDNKAWLYTSDGKAFSPEGLKFRDAVADLRAQGIKDPQRLADWGLKLAGVTPNNVGPGAQEARQDANPSPTQNKSTPAKDPVTGKFVKAEEPKSKQESFLDEMRRKAKATTNQGSHGSNGGEPVVANDGELESMFTKAFSEHMAGAA